MKNKTLTITLFLVSFCTIFSCTQPTEKTNEEKETSEKAAMSYDAQEMESKDMLSSKIGEYLKTEFLTEADLRAITADKRKFQFSTIDLNGDGVEEIFVYLNSSYFCGSGGCTFLLMDNELALISEFTVTEAPILVSNEVENGWKKLYLLSNGYRELTYNTQSKSYPANPSMVEKVNEDPNNQKEIVKLFGMETQTSTSF